MNNEQITLFLQVVTGLMSSAALVMAALPAIRKSKSEVVKTSAETTDTYVKAAGANQDNAIELYETYKKEAKEERDENERLRKMLEEERMKVAKLELELDAAKRERNAVIEGDFINRNQLLEIGIKPRYCPPGFYV